MNISDWITLLAVIVALVLGVWSNIQTQWIKNESNKRERRERKERLINEIQTWIDTVTTQFNGCFVNPINDSISSEKSADVIAKSYLASAINIGFEYAKLPYFKSIAKDIDLDIENAINNLDEPLKTLIDSIFDASKFLKGVPMGKPLTTQVLIEALEKAKECPETSNGIEIEKITSIISKNASRLNLSLRGVLSEIAKSKLALLKE
jgi:hypothetical protein